MGGDLISVIIPAFNTEAYIRSALESALSQKCEGLDLDVIVVDDGSTDGTTDIVRRYLPQIRYFPLQHTGRPAVVRNHGLRHARGRWVAFLDADDFWLPGSLYKRLCILKTNDDLGFTYGNYYNKIGESLHLCFTTTHPPSGDIFAALFQKCFVDTSSVLVRRELLQVAGGFYERVHTAEDYWLWLRLARLAKAAFIAEPVAVKHVHPDSISHSPTLRKLNDLICVTTAIAAECQVDPRLVRERVNPLRIWLARILLQQGHYAATIQQLARALWDEPGLTVGASRRLLHRYGVLGAAK